MPRIPAFDDIDAAPEAARPALRAIQAEQGEVANVFRVLAGNPAVLDGLVAAHKCLAQGRLTPAMRVRIALAVAEANGCDYCLSRHVERARTWFGLDDAEITANRNGSSNDPAIAAAVRFAALVVRGRGRVGDDDLNAVRAAGYDDAQLLEIVATAGLSTLANWVNQVSGTKIDFPLVSTRKAA